MSQSIPFGYTPARSSGSRDSNGDLRRDRPAVAHLVPNHEMAADSDGTVIYRVSRRSNASSPDECMSPSAINSCARATLPGVQLLLGRRGVKRSM
jgi:hypothetical protein